jgi:hypothetical protein
MERSVPEGDKTPCWAAIGALGRILERAGHLDQALRLWREAFDDGSCDLETIDRLSMHLERAKDYAGAILVIRGALSRHMSAFDEELLRKRLARCEWKTIDRGSAKTSKRPDVAAYSVRRQSSPFEQVFQIRFKPPLENFELIGDTARCLLVSSKSSTLVDVDLASGSELRRIENLPLLGAMRFAPDGRGIGLHRTAAVGKGPTLLKFVNAEGRVVSESSVPDATSEVALGPDLWYVGCRDGLLYAFGLEGKQRWAWETPGVRDCADDPYFRPCPYYVASRQSFAALASMENIYAVSPNGNTLWQAALPNEDQRRYEPILAGSGGGTASAGITVSIEISGYGPTASFLAASLAGVIVGSSQGHLYRFDLNGTLRDARALGDGPVRVGIKPDGTVGAAWCGGVLFFPEKNNLIKAPGALDRPSELTMFGDDAVLSQRNNVQIIDADGRLLWAVEFSRSVTNVATHGNIVVCAAGVLAAFRRLAR